MAQTNRKSQQTHQIYQNLIIISSDPEEPTVSAPINVCWNTGRRKKLPRLLLKQMT